MKRAILLTAMLAGGVLAPRAAELRSTGIDVLLRTAVDQTRVPMAVATVADSRGTIFEGAAGVDKDAIFAIASMTKPVTLVAVMQLVETGRVRLDEPASTYVSELATARVVERGALRAQKTAVTVRHLLSHTAGFGYEVLNREILDLVSKKALPSMMAGGDAGAAAVRCRHAVGVRVQHGLARQAGRSRSRRWEAIRSVRR